MSNAGKKVKVHYTGTLDDGSTFDSSYDRNQPLEFTCMAGMMIPGFDNAVNDMQVGDKVVVHLDPKDAYGEVNPDAVRSFPLANFRGVERYAIGETILLQTSDGRPVQARLTEIGNKTVTFDFNHELAGKPLNFEIELLEAA